MAFLPSRDLPALHVGGKGKKEKELLIQKGLDCLAIAFGVQEDEEEHYYYGREEDDEQIAATTSRLNEEEKQGNSNSDDDLEGREDVFELQYTKEWLSGVSCLRWIPKSRGNGKADGDEEDDDEDDAQVDEILRKAARLIAVCAGKSGEERNSSSVNGCPPVLLMFLLRSMFHSLQRQANQREYTILGT
jgi:hypothetical protein